MIKQTLFLLLYLVLVLAFSSVYSSDIDQFGSYCKKMDEKFSKYSWGKSRCEEFKWTAVRRSVWGDPLTWIIFGNDDGKYEGKDITMIMCGVHGDEITPVKFCFDIIYYLEELSKDKTKFEVDFKDKLVIVAPLVNPDSFFKISPTRTNARGIDVNRNFPTIDWLKDARKMWATKYKRDKRRNPGLSPISEPEVVFQVNLIKRYSPDKIISVHAPLSLLDYDGPNTIVTSGVDGTKANELLIQISQEAKDYRIENYPFFPGSLGNWAGKERDIPTYTLELPTSNPAKSKEYWDLFREAMYKAMLNGLIDRNTQTRIGKNETPQEETQIEKTDQKTQN